MSTLVGRAGLVLKDAWDSDAAYDIMDVVTYNNSVYIAKQLVPAGTLPTNTTYWIVAIDASLLQTKVAGANKVSSATNGNFAALDSNGDLADSGHKHNDYATKVSSATNGHLAGLDANGNLTDSGIASNMLILKKQTIEWTIGDVTAGTGYSYDITANYPNITKSSLRSMTIYAPHGANVIDYSGSLMASYGASDPTKVFARYTAGTTQASVKTFIEILYS